MERMNGQDTLLQPGDTGLKVISIREELLQINGLEAVYHGCDQTWYKTVWQRMSGCGPTTASSLFLYHRRSKKHMPQPEKAECLRLMEEFWGYITPTARGVHTTKEFCEGAERFAKAHSLRVDTATLDVPKEPDIRPTRDTVLRFLEEALQNDLPVAFLNHNNGAEKRLDSHHWVAIVALSYVPDGETEITFVDESIIKRIDIASWLRTTTGGGGFATLRFF